MNETPQNNEDIIDDTDFSYDGFQVVRGEFFAHIFEPSFTLNNYKCGVNTACIKRLPDYDYVQILVNPTTKKVAVRPCSEEEKDSLRWCSASGKRTPKQITCRIFYAKIMSLMNWDTTFTMNNLLFHKRQIRKSNRCRYMTGMPNFPVSH